MQKKIIFVMIAALAILIACAGCASQYTTPDKDLQLQTMKSEKVKEDAAEDTPSGEEDAEEEQEEGPAAGTGGETEEDTPEEEPAEEVAVEPVREPAQYREAEPEPSKIEKDNCGCTFRWEPVCGVDGKTYINECLFQCFGNSLDRLESRSKCPKKQGPPDIYVDDVEFDYETDRWNAAYCWRMMYRESGIRHCENLIVNGRVNTGPEPKGGDWLDEEHIVADKKGRKDSYSIRLETGQQAENEEYDTAYQPLFEPGRYRFSFWARNDLTANNDWKVRLTLKDWWDRDPRPPGVKGCYQVWTEIRCEDHFFEGDPTDWRHYHYEFDVPIDFEQWHGNRRQSAECEYDWDMIPHGYAIEATGPTIGHAWFDDFVLEKVE